jgi:ribosome maturation factor RimP
MISKEKILNLINDLLKEKKIFLVSLDVSPSNSIRLVIDTMKGITINECAKISRTIENGLNRESADFNIEVTSPGLDTPFKVREQFVKYTGQEVEVILKTGQKTNGILIHVNDKGFVIKREKKIRVDAKKKEQRIEERINFTYDSVSKVKNVIKF